MKVCVVTPWYPDRAHPFSGIFVRQQVDALRARGVEVEVEVAMTHPVPAGVRTRRAARAIDRLAASDPRAVYGTDDGLSVIPTLTPPRVGYAGRARAFADALGRKRTHLPIHADVVHAHVALPAGHAALAVDDRPVVVTEHFTGLGRLLHQRDAAEMYHEVVRRSASYAAVSDSLRGVVSERFDDLADRLGVTPNIVDLTDIPFSPPSGRPGRSWLYVGNLTPVKGVELLVRSFDRHRERVPEATLTVVGIGPLEDSLRTFVERRGLSSSVRFAGAVERSEIGPFFAAADIMVHLSTVETFGIATVEAIGAGLPVVNLDNGAASEVWGEIREAVGEILPANASAGDVCEAVARIADSDSLDPTSGRAFVQQRFSPGRVAGDLLDVYRSVM